MIPISVQSIAQRTSRKQQLGALASLLRPHHWLKNLLVFVPIVLGHRLSDSVAWNGALAAFATLCVTASALYVFNDILDLPGDREHLWNKTRPLACGAVSKPAARILMAALLAGAVLLATVLNPTVRWWILTYAAGSVAYSLVLKRFLMLDIVLLAGLYVVRLLCGGAATGIRITLWTLAFSAFLFLSLALVKRVSELSSVETAFRRPYRPSDRPLLAMLAVASGYLSLLVLVLYINSPEVGHLYRRPQLLLLALPALCYGVSRVLLLAYRGEMHHDPVVFAFRDLASWMAGVVSLAAMLIAY